MRSLTTLLLTLSLIFVISCASRAVKQEETDPWHWLNMISGGKPPEIDITGKWHDELGSTFFGWGEGYLRQEQNQISGTMGDYNIKGIVSGKIVYLVFLRHGRVHYTARLEMSQNLLTGYYFKATDKEQKKGYPTSFIKIVDPTKK